MCPILRKHLMKQELSSVTDTDITKPKMFYAKGIFETILNSSDGTWTVVNREWATQWSMKNCFRGVCTWKSTFKQFMKELSHSSATCALKVFQWEIVWLNTWNQLIKLHMNLSNVLYVNLYFKKICLERTCWFCSWGKKYSSVRKV